MELVAVQDNMHVIGNFKMKQLIKFSGWVQVGIEQKIAIVFPDGTGPLPDVMHTWNSGYCCGYALRNNINDVEFFRVLIPHLLQKHPQLDKRRVYLVGHSDGGMMSYRVAGSLSEMISAAAIVSGTIGGQEHRDAPVYITPTPKVPVPVLHVHGKLDTIIPIEGGEIPGNPMIHMSMKQAIQFWVKANQCLNESSIEMSRNRKIQLESFSKCVKGSHVMAYTLFERGHQWRDMDSEVNNEEFYGKSLAESIWNLIKSFVK